MDDLNAMRMHEREYESLDKEIKRSMKRTAAEVVRLGFFLRKMMNEQLYLVYYTDFDSYLQEELHIDYSKANRFMNINKKFSFNGNSMTIDEKYKGYSQSLLEEMLSMPEELKEKITPDMTARQVREIKRQTKQQEQGNTDDVDYKEIETRQEQMIATPQEPVDTGSEEELLEDIVVEIEADAEADSGQEELSIEFDTNELLGDLDDAIDAEYKEAGVTAVEERTSAGLSAYRLPKTEYPEGSLLTSSGCGHHSCFMCARECNIRQDERYCRDAPLGNPYSCTTMNSLNIMRADGGTENCQFLDQELADKAADGTPEPCCKECPTKDICGYCCNAAKPGHPIGNTADLEEYETEADIATSQQHDIAWFVQQYAKIMPDEAARMVEICRKEQGSLEKAKAIQQYIAPYGHHAASCRDYGFSFHGFGAGVDFRIGEEGMHMTYRNLVRGLIKLFEKEGYTQPDFPVFKDNEQRKQWLSGYKAWGLWYRDENIDVNYYKFDFPDGSRLVVAEYPQRHSYWKDERKDEHYFHLLEKNKTGHKKKYDGQYRQQTDSETYLVEFLKNLQRKEVIARQG